MCARGGGVPPPYYMYVFILHLFTFKYICLQCILLSYLCLHCKYYLTLLHTVGWCKVCLTGIILSYTVWQLLPLNTLSFFSRHVCDVGGCRWMCDENKIKKNEKKIKKLEIHVGMCRCSGYLCLPFPTCGCSKYAESLKFLRSRFCFDGRGEFPNDFKGLHSISGPARKKMV